MTALPNLSTWHPAPIGATIPARTPYAYTYEKGFTVALDGHFQDIAVPVNDYTYYTEHPLTIPLPTEEGATILATVSSHDVPYVLLTRQGNCWTTAYDSIWYDNQIAAWAPVTIGEVRECFASE